MRLARLPEVLLRTVTRGAARVRTFGEGPGRPLALSIIPVTLVLGLMNLGLIGWTVTEPLDELTDAHGLAVFHEGRLSPVQGSLRVFEDGVEIGHAPQATADVAAGEGRFSLWRGLRHAGVLFTASDNTDPRTNGRVYEARYLWAPNLLFFLLLLVCLALNEARLIKALGRAEQIHPVWITATVIVLALLYRIRIAIEMGDSSFGGVQIKGVPYSDARMWFEMSSDFAAGAWNWGGSWGTWVARRPFYYVLSGSLFALTGPSLFALRVLQITLASMGAGLIFDGLRRVTPLPIAVLGALSFTFSYHESLWTLASMTETVGAFFTNAALWACIVGLAGQKRFLVAAGVCLALANLARPLNIVLLAAVPVMIVALGFERRVRASDVRRALLFVAGGLALIAPWLLRQNLLFDITTISENGSEALFAATTPDYGSWVSSISGLTQGLSVPDRVAFYDAGVREHLNEHLGWYLQHVFEVAGEVVTMLAPSRALLLAGFILALLHRHTGGATRIIAGILAFALYVVNPAAVWILVPLGVFASLPRRSPLVTLSVFLAVTVASLGIVAYPSLRLVEPVQWQADVAALLCVWAVIHRTVDFAPTATASWGALRPWLVRALGLALTLFFVGTGISTARNLNEVEAPAFGVSVAPHEAASIVSEALASPSAVAYRPLSERLRVVRATLPTMHRFAMPIDAKERVPHPNAVFNARPYAFTVFRAESQPAVVRCVFPAQLPSATAGEALLVGLTMHHDTGDIFEVVAIKASETWTQPPASVAEAHLKYIE